MSDIQDIEEIVLIETDYFNMGIGNLIGEIMVKKKGMDEKEIYDFASNIISSMIAQGLVKVVKTEYKKVDEDTYEPLASCDLTDEELDSFLKHPENWEDTGVFSKTLPYELSITDVGREKMSS